MLIVFVAAHFPSFWCILDKRKIYKCYRLNFHVSSNYCVIPEYGCVYTTPYKTNRFFRIVQKSHLQRSYAIFTEIDCLCMLSVFPREKVQRSSVNFWIKSMIHLETFLEDFGCAPFSRHHDVEVRLIPVVIIELYVLIFYPCTFKW